jgi:hypothetical protein
VHVELAKCWRRSRVLEKGIGDWIIVITVAEEGKGDVAICPGGNGHLQAISKVPKKLRLGESPDCWRVER